MKITLSILALLISVNFSFAQHKSKSRTKTTTSEGTTQEIHVNIDSKEKMELAITEYSFRMKLKYPQKHQSSIEQLVSKYVRYFEQNTDDEIKVNIIQKSRHLEIYADLELDTQEDKDQLTKFTTELFSILHWEIEIIEL